jgi:hypothetical protein
MSIIYTVTTINRHPQRNRCVGWFSDKIDAIKAVKSNTFDMYEDGYYRYVIIEKMEEGIYPIILTAWLYEWNSIKRGYELICTDSDLTNAPEWFSESCNFGIG